MCTGLEPLALAGLAASVGGSIYNSNIQNNAIKEQNRQNQMALEMERQARDEEMRRQREFEQQQTDEVTNAMFEANPEQVAQIAVEVADSPETPINQALDTFNTTELAGQVQNEDVQESIGTTIANQAEQTRRLLRNAALLYGQHGALADAETALGRMGSEVATAGSNRQGSLGVSMFETNVPTPVVTPSDSIIGDLLMLGGQGIAGMAGKSVGSVGGTPFGIGSIFSNKRPLNAIPWMGGINL